LHLLDSIVEEAKLHRGTQKGRVRVAAFPTIATHLLPTLTAQFRQAHPEISVSLLEFYDAWEAERAVREKQADLGFTELPTGKEFDAIELFHDDYIALLPASAQIPNEVITFEQLASFPIISFKPGNSCYKRLQQYLSRSGASLRVAHEVRDSLTIVNLVHQGLGAAIVSRLSVQPLPEGVQVRQLPTPLERILCTITLTDQLHSPALFTFLDFVKRFGYTTLRHKQQLLQPPLQSPLQGSLAAGDA
ncbi:MAG: LysR family transcriptional regulator substrate-binding protein, partial [Cyanobacteria bacterium P01_H01_bin.121]